MESKTAAIAIAAGAIIGAVSVEVANKVDVIGIANATMVDRTITMLANTATVSHGVFEVTTGPKGEVLAITLNECGFAQSTSGEPPDIRCVNWQPEGDALKSLSGFITTYGLPVMRKRLGLEK